MNDSRTTAIISILITILIWILIFVGCSFIAFEQPQEEFKEIQINLGDIPVPPVELPKEPVKTERTESAAEKLPLQEEVVAPSTPAPAAPEAPAPKVESRPETRKPEPVKTEPKKTSARTETKTETPKIVEKAPEPVKYKKSIEELTAEMNKPKKQAAQVDWDSMFKDADETKSETAKKTSVTNGSVPSLLGSSASSSSGPQTQQTSKSQDGKNANPSASDTTNSALNAVKTASFSMSASDNVRSESSISSTNSNGKVSVAMSDGTLRELLDPKKPVIFLTEEETALIDTTKKVQIRFTVTKDGRVPINEVKISPSAILPEKIQSTVATQVSGWRFAPASTDGSATFNYTIKKN